MIKMDLRQSVLRRLLNMIGNTTNEQADTVLDKVDAELGKLFEDRNILLSGGGNVAVNAGATSVTFSASLKLHINSQVAGGAPTIIDLGSATQTFSSDGNMFYVIIDRLLGTATVPAVGPSLPLVTSTNQEVFLIAKRVGTSIIFRDGTVIPAGRTIILGSSDLFGSLGSTTNALVKTNGTDGKTVQGTNVIVDGSNNMSGINDLKVASSYVGSGSKDASAILQADSATQGFLPPRTVKASIGSPVEGLMIYDTTDKKMEFFNGSIWATIAETVTLHSQTFTTLGLQTFTVPTGVTWVIVRGCGGGGGGGGGGGTGGGIHNPSGGGGGGGGSTPQQFVYAVSPGTVNVYIGDGGAGGAGATFEFNDGSPGVKGQDSYFGSLYFGGSYGGGGGGRSNAGGLAGSAASQYLAYRMNQQCGSGAGGSALNAGSNGNASQWAAGGIGGIAQSVDGYPGGGGGGGGAGIGAGANGGNGRQVVTGNNGSAAGANTGAGGGGGGGSENGGGGTGGNGGKGGSGVITVFWIA
jgi:hypothetical protein